MRPLKLLSFFVLAASAWGQDCILTNQVFGPCPVVQTKFLPSVFVGTPYSANVTATGFEQVYSLDTSLLPTGLSAARHCDSQTPYFTCWLTISGTVASGYSAVTQLALPITVNTLLYLLLVPQTETIPMTVLPASAPVGSVYLTACDSSGPQVNTAGTTYYVTQNISNSGGTCLTTYLAGSGQTILDCQNNTVSGQYTAFAHSGSSNLIVRNCLFNSLSELTGNRTDTVTARQASNFTLYNATVGTSAGIGQYGDYTASTAVECLGNCVISGTFYGAVNLFGSGGTSFSGNVYSGDANYNLPTLTAEYQLLVGCPNCTVTNVYVRGQCNVGNAYTTVPSNSGFNAATCYDPSIGNGYRVLYPDSNIIVPPGNSNIRLGTSSANLGMLLNTFNFNIELQGQYQNLTVIGATGLGNNTSNTGGPHTGGSNGGLGAVYAVSIQNSTFQSNTFQTTGTAIPLFFGTALTPDLQPWANVTFNGNVFQGSLEVGILYPSFGSSATGPEGSNITFTNNRFIDSYGNSANIVFSGRGDVNLASVINTAASTGNHCIPEPGTPIACQ